MGGPRGPPPPIRPRPEGQPPPKPKPIPSGGCGLSELLQKSEGKKKAMDDKALDIDNVDLSGIDPDAKQDTQKCPRCELQVLVQHFSSHMTAHSTEILPWLFLGGNRNAENEKELTVRTQITHILNLAHECNIPPVIREPVEEYNRQRGLEFVYKKIAWLDLPEQSLHARLPEALQFLEEAHSDDRNHVLVHCVQGISRSTSVVIAYLMKHEGMSLREAFNYVTSRRPVALPRRDFMDQLGEIECQLKGIEETTLTSEEVFKGKNMLNLD